VSASNSHDDAGVLRKNSEKSPGPLGLSVIYTPESDHKADIVFVHGLGGSSRMTWSKDRNPELFWPSTFLPLEPEICMARILSFGYQSNFHKPGNASTVVLDFAKELLYDLKYAIDNQGANLTVGSVSEMMIITCYDSNFRPRSLCFSLLIAWEGSSSRR